MDAGISLELSALCEIFGGTNQKVVFVIVTTERTSG
jgi:hypothetical protein